MNSNHVDLQAVSLIPYAETREIQRVPTRLIAPETQPDLRQPRLLPLPSELVREDGTPAPEFLGLVGELRALGFSLREHQIQPIVIYPGTSTDFPEAQYLILVGHRRWIAAVLVGLDSLNAIMVDPPDNIERLQLQYTENEAREEFSDIERMWAIKRMRQAMGDIPWKQVEERLKIGTARREQLMRMSIFTQKQQEQIALLGIQETQIRPLHKALRNKTLSNEQADTILARLMEISRERTTTRSQDSPKSGIDSSSHRTQIDGPTIARLVAQAIRQASSKSDTPRARWLPPFQRSVTSANQAIMRLQQRATSLDPSTAETVLADLDHLIEQANKAKITIEDELGSASPEM